MAVSSCTARLIKRFWGSSETSSSSSPAARIGDVRLQLSRSHDCKRIYPGGYAQDNHIYWEEVQSLSTNKATLSRDKRSIIVHCDQLSPAELKAGAIRIDILGPRSREYSMFTTIDFGRQLGELPTMRHREFAECLDRAEDVAAERQKRAQDYQKIFSKYVLCVDSARLEAEKQIRGLVVDSSAFDCSAFADPTLPQPRIKLVCQGGGAPAGAAAGLDEHEGQEGEILFNFLPFAAASDVIKTAYLKNFRERNEISLPFEGSPELARKLGAYINNPAKLIELNDEEAFALHQFAVRNQMPRIVAQTQWKAARHVLAGDFRSRLELLTPEQMRTKLGETDFADIAGVYRREVQKLRAFYADNLKQMLPEIPESGAAASGS